MIPGKSRSCLTTQSETVNATSGAQGARLNLGVAIVDHAGNTSERGELVRRLRSVSQKKRLLSSRPSLSYLLGVRARQVCEQRGLADRGKADQRCAHKVREAQARRALWQVTHQL